MTTSRYLNPVSVPVRLDFAWSDGLVRVAPPATDFTRLQDCVVPSQGNPGDTKPWLGETVCRPVDEAYSLAKGMHLHWTLPAALRHGATVYVLDCSVFNELVQQGVPFSLVLDLQTASSDLGELTLTQLNALLASLLPSTPAPPLKPPAFKVRDQPATFTGLLSPDANVIGYSLAPELHWDAIMLDVYAPMIIRAAARMKLPPVPNRWLVVREDMGATLAWVVESDRLSPPSPDGTPLPDTGPTAYPGEFAFAPSPDGGVPIGKQQVVRFLGRSTPALSWQEAPSTDNVARLAPFTAGGNGRAEFATFYPECQGVFGFCDSSADQSISYTYTVIGWFADASDDPLSTAYAVTPWASENDRAARTALLNWHLDGTPDWRVIDGSVYVARASVSGHAVALSAAAELADVTVAVGNTAGEALAAYLAAAGGGAGNALGLPDETLLDAAQAGVLAAVQEADGPAVIDNALHQNAFQSSSDGFLWTLVPKPLLEAGLAGRSKVSRPAIDSALGTALATLNRIQEQFDRVQRYIRAQRRQLFADWCRALHLQTDTAAGAGAFPNGGTLGPNGSEFQALATDVLNQTAYAVDFAGPGGISADGVAGANAMLAYNAAVALYLARAGLLEIIHDNPAWILQRQAAPRFWRPNDPVVLMADPGRSSLKAEPASPLPFIEIGNKDYLRIELISAAQQDAPFLPAVWVTGPSAGCIVAAMEASALPYRCPSWRPLSLQWQADYLPYPGAGKIAASGASSGPFSVSRYPASFISDNFIPDPYGVDLIAKEGLAPDLGQRATYDGRAVLSSHPTRTMRERILQLVGAPISPQPATLPLLPAAWGPAQPVLAAAYDSNPLTLSQALDGFHERLLMLRRTPQISIADPSASGAAGSDSTWDTYSQSLFVEIGQQAIAAPEQDDLFNPLRAGQCEITQLSIVDSFGQIRRWQPTAANTILAASLPKASAVGTGPTGPCFQLPPRLSQAARIQLRWIASVQPASNNGLMARYTPVCGWLALNRMDETIMIFDSSGQLVGQVPSGGGPMIAPPGAAGSTANPYLQQVISQAECLSPKSSLFDDISNALLTIEPRRHQHFTGRSCLMSRPLALARASLSLETWGPPAPHQGYQWLGTARFAADGSAKTDPDSPLGSPSISPFVQREDCGLSSVAFPARLGDVSMDDDGLVAYWTMAANICPTLSPSYQLVSSTPEAEGGAEPTLPLNCAPASAPTELLLLLDPRAPVHVSTGILPSKAIDLPMELFTPALQKIDFLMTVGPVVTPAGQALLPLPTETGARWEWIEAANGQYTISPQNGAVTPGAPAFSGKLDDRAHELASAPTLRSGWLRMRSTVASGVEAAPKHPLEIGGSDHA